jgi:hypothetical protein
MPATRVLLKVTGFSSATKLRDDVGSYLVDIGYIHKLGEGFALLAPDNPENVRLDVQSDFDWFKACVMESLRHTGERGVLAERYEETT